jgi:catechol 2,3-dioxygenase-like lactoylglutathione lyase family enzyme
MIKGIFHVSFTVKNLEASVKWYTEVLGLEYFRGQEQHNEYTGKLVGYPNAHLKVAQLKVPGQPYADGANHHIELVEYINPPNQVGNDLNTYNVANGHWAFVVDDIHAEFARMKTLGVQFKHEKPVAIEAGVNKGGFAIYLFDLDGITLELLQPPSKERAALNRPS